MTTFPPFRAHLALVALAAALVLAGCGGSSFSAGSGEPDASTGDGGPDGDIIVGTGHDASSPGLDASHAHDAHEDARPAEGGPAVDSGAPDGAMTPEAGDGSTGCPSGYLDCMGTCTQEGLTNCGTCGHDCANLPHVSGSVTCGTGGVCTFTNCEPGWAHCTSNPDDGCETSTAASPNCGGCGVTCSGGTPVCNGTSCVSGCSGSTPTYCTSTSTCVNTTNDPQNCNGCGNACASGPPAIPSNSGPACDAGMCGWTCDAGYKQCGSFCVAVAPDAVAGVFVSQGGAMSSCGSIAAPCGSVTAALAAVALSSGSKTIVYVAESSTPYVEQVTLPAGVTIQGGWTYTGGGQWAHPCALDPTQTVIQAPAGDDRVIIANYDGASTLDTLEVNNPTTATAGQSLYGVFVTGATTALNLANVAVDVAAGGAASQESGTGTNGSTPPSCSAGTGVGAGGTGTAGMVAAGSYSAAGYAPGNGGPGGTGGTGANGTPAPFVPSPCLTKVTYCKTVCPILAPPYCAQPSAYACECGYTEPSCPTMGTHGCGGTGGGGGNGGNGGGSSVGVFIGGSSVTFSATAGHATAIAPGAGGNGSSGQTGGMGGGPSNGNPGTAGTSGSEGCSSGTNGACVSCTIVPGTAAGAAGGDGVAGGPGGTGGGGAGGDSLCYATAGTVTVTGAPTCSAGLAGQGGNQMLPNQGPAGSSGLHN